MVPAWRTRSSMSWLYRSLLFLAWYYCKIFYRLKIYAHKPFYEGGAILASNHTSFLDPTFVSVSCPQEVHFLARESLFKFPLFGRFIRALNAHPVTGGASDIAVFRLVDELLRQGKKIVLFPEGTRSPDNKLGPIKPGIGLLVLRSNAAIIPTYVDGAYKIWNRKRRFPKLWGKAICVFGSPIFASSYAHLEKKEAQKAIADKLHQSLENLRAWLESGAKGSPP